MEFSRHACWSGQAFPSPGVFPTQGSDPALVPHPLHCRQVLYHVSHQGSFPVMVCLDRLLIFIWLTCAVPYSSAYSLCFSSFVSCFLPFCVSSFLPFPQSCPTLCDPMDSTVHGISRPECWSGSLFLLQGDYGMSCELTRDTKTIKWWIIEALGWHLAGTLFPELSW